MSTHVAVGGRSYEFGLRDRLRIAREEAGFDQRGFEAVVGLSRGSISNYERGTSTPRRPALIAWAMATGFSLAWIETGQDDPGDPDGDGGVRREGIEPPTRWFDRCPGQSPVVDLPWWAEQKTA